MSKKSDARTALIEKRVLEEQAWTYEQRIVRGLSWHAIRALAMRPRDAGGIDRVVGISTLKDLVAAHRAAQGEIVGTREERVERRQLEYDELALLARGALAAKASDPLYPGVDVNAAKLLLDVRAAEAKMHGDDKPAEAKVEIVSRDAVLDELNAELAAMGEQTVGVES
jgi:hypothetical protein